VSGGSAASGFAALLTAGFMTACGPISVEQAERECFERARLAQQPRGEVGIGIGSNGKAAGSLELEVTSDYLMGRDPSAVYETCVMAKSGEAPSRPLYARPDWKN
jgi:hypothetical protein